jgi:hypothetical protein
MNYHLDPLLQHDYLFYSVRKQKRYSKWKKKDKDADLEAVKMYFNYGYQKAKEAMPLLNKQQLEYIKDKVKGNALVR